MLVTDTVFTDQATVMVTVAMAAMAALDTDLPTDTDMVDMVDTDTVLQNLMLDMPLMFPSILLMFPINLLMLPQYVLPQPSARLYEKDDESKSVEYYIF